ncbi:hypothetical protein [Pelosinus fermentans]|uniref:hypothetical protein n=1 Tax=Pelosinus fermentans TaxID=365349 RepID=UPI00030A2A9D|nr:hypothetical protein [Pelosinus fermentans]
MFTIPIGKYFETIIIWLRLHFDGFFNITRKALTSFINGFEDTLLFLPAGAVILLMAGSRKGRSYFYGPKHGTDLQHGVMDSNYANSCFSSYIGTHCSGNWDSIWYFGGKKRQV